MNLTHDENESARFARIEALPATNESFATLKAALGDASWSVRQAAAERLIGLSLDVRACREIALMLRDRDNTGARNAAAWVLSKAGPHAVEVTAPLLTDADADLRKFAADILGDSHHSGAVDPLVLALNDVDGNVSLAATEALGKIGGAAAIDSLRHRLETGPLISRVAALEALTSLGVAAPLPIVVAMANEPASARSAYRAAARILDFGATLMLCRGLLSHATRDAALSAFGLLTSHSRAADDEIRTAVRLIPDAHQWLEKVLASDDDERRRGALRVVQAAQLTRLVLPVCRLLSQPSLAENTLRALIRLGPSVATMLLNPSRLSSFDEDVLLLVGEVIAELADGTHVAALLTFTKSTEPNFVSLALKALGQTRSKEAIVPLVEALAGEHAAIATSGLIAIGKSWPEAVKVALTPLQKPAMAPAALKVWATVAPADAVTLIQQYSQSTDPTRRQCAVELAHTLGPGAFELLQASMLDENALVREAVCRSLALISPDKGAPLLLQSLRDSSERVVCAAIQTAGDLRLEAARPALLLLLAKAEPSILLVTLQALERLGASNVDLPEALFTHTESDVVKQALMVCATGPRARPRLRKALLDARWTVRAAAARLLALAGSPEDVPALELALSEESNDLAHEAMRSSLTHLRPFAPHAP